ncbi:MAG: FG-GAP-like repeat-containing protein, partial [Deltaproteobacteria bacterium]|nr:FG-GAP-like repeat-containing protein [Deltaproteobacteria bacterium]
MSKTKPIFLLLAIFAMAALISSSALLAQDDEKTKVRHPSYTLLGHDPPPAEDSPLNPNFLIAQEARVVEGTLWHGNYISERMVGLDVGDADGDGRNEVVYATTRNVYLARRNGQALEQLAVYNVPASFTILSVDFYDTDGNGRQEIIVSAQKSGSGPSSYVMGFTGDKELTVLADYIPWYLRVIGSPDAKMLAAQKGGTNAKEAFSGNVMFATFSDGKVTANQKVDVPFGATLYSFNQGKMGSAGQNLTAVISSPQEHLRLY